MTIPPRQIWLVARTPRTVQFVHHLSISLLLAFVATTSAASTIAPSTLPACNDEEVGYVASFNVKQGTEAEFEMAIATLAATVMRVESGVILYAPYKGVDGKYFMMERYENEAARKAHGKAPEVSALFPSLGQYMDGAPDVQPVSAVCFAKQP